MDVVDKAGAHTLWQYSIAQGLLERFPEAEPIHVLLFLMAEQVGPAIDEAATALGMSEAAVQAAINDLSDLGLIQSTSPLGLTDQGRTLVEAALRVALDMEEDNH
jgi:Mn-dependent DtxR family transcriptional regulator